MKMIIAAKAILAILPFIVITGIEAGAESNSTKREKATDIPLEELSAEPITPIQLQEPSSRTAPDKTAVAGKIDWQVMSCGGAINGSSADFILSGTTGQAAISWSISDIYKLDHGFWAEFASGETCCRTPGDANGDMKVDVSDVVFIINLVFKDGPDPNCPAEADANGDCIINVADAVFLVIYTFAESPPLLCGCAE